MDYLQNGDRKWAGYMYIGGYKAKGEGSTVSAETSAERGEGRSMSADQCWKGRGEHCVY